MSGQAPRPRLSEPALRVLRVMLDEPDVSYYGLQLMDQAGVRSGFLYPLLARLASAGWLVGEREEVDPSAAGRPARTYYRLTPLGKQQAQEALTALSPAPRLRLATS